MRTAVFLLLIGLLGRVAHAQDYDALGRLLDDATPTTGPTALTLSNAAGLVYTHQANAPGQTLAPDDRTALASATKWLSAVVVLAVAEQGLLSLDDPISRFLPAFTGTRGTITLRQLLSHTSGLPGVVAYLNDRTLTLAQSVDSIARYTPLIYPPGEGFGYGGVSFQVAGRVAEVATGLPWDTLFVRFVARPCGMNHTDYGPLPYRRIAGGAYSTALDYARFVRMILNQGTIDGTRVVGPESLRQLRQNHRAGLPTIGADPYAQLGGAGQYGYGLGVWLEETDADGQGLLISCAGATGVSPWVDYCHGLAGALFCRRTFRACQPTYRRLQTAAAALMPDSCRPPAHAEETAAAERWVFPDFARAEVTARAHGWAVVFNARGQTVWRGTLGGERRINVADWPAGLYLFCRRSGRHRYTARIVKPD